MPTFWVAIAGAAGAVLRYRLGLAIGVRTFPWATLGINLAGCFLLALVVAGPIGSRWSSTIAVALAVGFLGSFTTFSTFGYETFTLLHTGRSGAALGYVAASVGGGVLGAASGYALARRLI